MLCSVHVGSPLRVLRSVHMGKPVLVLLGGITSGQSGTIPSHFHLRSSHVLSMAFALLWVSISPFLMDTTVPFLSAVSFSLSFCFLIS